MKGKASGWGLVHRIYQDDTVQQALTDSGKRCGLQRDKNFEIGKAKQRVLGSMANWSREQVSFTQGGKEQKT